MRLSFAQEQIWFVNRFERGRSVEYNVPSALRLKGFLDVGSIERAIQTIIDRHQILRAHFREVEGIPDCK